MEYPVCKLWLRLVERYETMQPFTKFSKDHSLNYRKVKEYGSNSFKNLDYVFIEKICKILKCDFDEMFVEDREQYIRLRGTDKVFHEEGTGVVYFIKNNEGYTKIGKTHDLKNRLHNLKYESYGKDLRVIHLIESRDIDVLEKTLHKVFAHKRVKGEWFDLSDEDINIFKDKPKEDEIS